MTLSRFTAVTLVCFAGLWLTSSCSKPVKRKVYVPGEGYAVSLCITLPVRAKVGEWITMHAERRSGPWLEVPADEVPAGTLVFEDRPPAVEHGVESNLAWVITPKGRCVFGVRGDAQGRTVQFNEPGRYTVWAISAYPTEARSSAVEIEIVAPDEGPGKTGRQSPPRQQR